MMNKRNRLPRRLSALALALSASLAVSALLAGSASAVSMSPPAGSFSLGGTSWVEAESAYGSQAVTCEKATGTGNVKEGTAKLTLLNCVRGPDLYNHLGKCTSPGQAAGTIVTSPLIVTLDYTYPETGAFGFGLKPQSGAALAQFTCSGWANVVWGGGFIMRVISPGINDAPTNVVNVKVDGEYGYQNYTALASDYTEPVPGFKLFYDYRLKQSWFGSPPTNSSIQFAANMTFPNKHTFLP